MADLTYGAEVVKDGNDVAVAGGIKTYTDPNDSNRKGAVVAVITADGTVMRLGQALAAASLPAVLPAAQETALVGTKVTAVTPLATGGVGIVGWLSQIWDVVSSKLPTLSSGRMPVELDAAALAALETITVASITAPIPAGTNNIGGVGVLTQVGAANIANAQATADTTSGGVTLVASRATRRSVTIVNMGTTAVYLGTGTVSTANGFLLPGVVGAAVTFNVTAAVKGIVASGSQAVGVLEEYD